MIFKYSQALLSINKKGILKDNKNFIEELKNNDYLVTISSQISYYVTPTMGRILTETYSIDGVYPDFIYYN